MSKPSAPRWWEEYRCGCLSDEVKTREDLPGYCPVHGENSTNVYCGGKHKLRAPRGPGEKHGSR